MANSFVDTLADGSTTLFSVPFGYIDRIHIGVLVDGDPVAFEWINDATISVVPAPLAGSTVRIRRVTPKDPIVDFRDGENLTEADLDNVSTQALFLAQESEDNLGAVMQATDTGQFDAQNRRVENLANPVNAQDAVTKLWAETAMSSELAQAIAARVAAQAAQAASESARDAAQASQSAAAGSASAASTSASNAATSASTATTQAGIATTKATEAAASAAAAAGSADQAYANAVATNGDVVATAANAATATAQAGVATAKAAEASGHAAAASDSADEAAASAASINPANLVEIANDQTITGRKTMNLVRQPISVLTWAATITPDFASANRFHITLGGATTIANPTNVVAGQSILIFLKQDGTGSRLVSWGSNWKFPAAVAPTLTTGANKVDVIVGEVLSSTEIICSAILNFG